MFLETPRFPTDLSFRKPGGPGLNVDVQILESGFEQRNAFWKESLREFDIGYGVRKLNKVQNVYAWFEAVGAMEHGFRLKDWESFKSVPITYAGDKSAVRDPISMLDQVISVDTTTTDIFQLIYTFRQGVFARKKSIVKPVGVPDTPTGTVLLAIQGIQIPTTRYDCLYVPDDRKVEGHETTGRITLTANITRAISSITQAAQAVVQTATAHGLSINDSVHFDSSVGGMTQIRGKRAKIVAVGDTTHFTIALDTTGFAAYTSGGNINTQRQSFAFTVSIAGITKQAFATVTSSAPHNLVPGDIGTIASVGGMTQINGLTAVVRQVLDATRFRIDVNSVLFSTYTSGGTFTVAERVTAGYEYDIPVRFNTNNFPMQFEHWEAGDVTLPIKELRVV